MEIGENFDGPFVTVNDFGLSYTAPATGSNNGKIGMLVGVLSAANSKFTANAEGIANKLYSENVLTSAKKEELNFNANYLETTIGDVTVTVYYVGQEGNYIGYSANYANGNAKIASKTYDATETASGLNFFSSNKNE